MTDISNRNDSKAQAMLQAVARWEHMPEGKPRDERILATYHEILSEQELLDIGLPDLSERERLVLWDESLMEVFHHYIATGTEPSEEMAIVLGDKAIALHQRLCLAAREQKATPKLRARLIMRRLSRKLAHTGGDAERKRKALAVVAKMVAEEPDQQRRAEAEKHAELHALQLAANAQFPVAGGDPS